MKPAVLLALLIDTVALAATLPTCATTCAVNNISKSSCLTDEKCLCQDSTYQAAFAQCVASSCSTIDQQATLQYGTELCASLGVGVTSSLASTSSAQSSSVVSSSLSTASATSAYASITSSALISSPNTTITSNGTTSSASATSVVPYTGGVSPLGVNTIAGAAALLGALIL